jgi:hypothetical protein
MNAKLKKFVGSIVDVACCGRCEKCVTVPDGNLIIAEDEASALAAFSAMIAADASNVWVESEGYWVESEGHWERRTSILDTDPVTGEEVSAEIVERFTLIVEEATECPACGLLCSCEEEVGA